jgi:hypothetical protein
MTTTTKQKLKIVVRVEHDEDTESPFEHDCFTLLSGFNDSEKFQDTFNEFMEDDDRIPGKDFWMLSCYRHGGESWSLLNEGYQCQWDTTRYAGVLYLENPKDRDQWKNVKDAARSTIETYNRWLSGDCWWYRIESEEETLYFIGGGGGIIGLEYALDEIQSSLLHWFKSEADKYEVVIQCDDAARTYESDIAERIKKVGLTLRGE